MGMVLNKASTDEAYRSGSSDPQKGRAGAAGKGQVRSAHCSPQLDCKRLCSRTTAVAKAGEAREILSGLEVVMATEAAAALSGLEVVMATTAPAVARLVGHSGCRTRSSQPWKQS